MFVSVWKLKVDVVFLNDGKTTDKGYKAIKNVAK